MPKQIIIAEQHHIAAVFLKIKFKNSSLPQVITKLVIFT